MDRFFATVTALAASAMVLSGAASADERTIHDAITASEIKAAMTEAGLNPTLLTDRATGAPVATGQTEGMIFVARALDCTGLPARCNQLLLYVNFDLANPVSDEDYRIVNAFNETNVNGRAYVLEDKSQIGVDFVIDMTGGVTGEHIGSRLQRWPEVIRDFRDEMLNARSGS